MNRLITECFNMLKGNGFDFAFCGGHALDIHIGKAVRPHGDIDISAFWEDRNIIIKYMQSIGWTVYAACGGGKIHLIQDVSKQKLTKSNIFCVKNDCPFFHVEPIENDIYSCEIDHVEQTELNFVEFLFNKRNKGNFIYSRNAGVSLAINSAILKRDKVPYLSPELVLLYKSTDLARERNRHDFDTIEPYLSAENRIWLINSLKTTYSDGHEWIKPLESRIEFWDVLDEHRNKTGRLHMRGQPMRKGDHHLVLHIWIVNSKGEFLISRRVHGAGSWSGKWQTTGGSAVAGDDSLTTALKETKEEIGISLDPKNGQLFKQYVMPHITGEGGAFHDVWLFRQDVDISDVVLQPGETCGAMLADKEQIRQIIDEGNFLPLDEAYPYLDELFYYCGKPF